MLLKNAPTQKSWWAGVWKCVWWSDGLRKQISGKLLLLCIEETVVVCVCAVVEWGVRMAFKVAPRGYAGVSSPLAIIRHLARFLLECTFKGVSLPWSAPSIFFTSHAHLILKMHHHPVNNMSSPLSDKQELDSRMHPENVQTARQQVQENQCIGAHSTPAMHCIWCHADWSRLNSNWDMV